MKIRTEISEDFDEEIIIRSKHMNDKISRLQSLISDFLGGSAEIMLQLGNVDYFIPFRDILFFETVQNRTTAHTKDGMYYTDYKLYELEAVLPHTFLRASKSCILNTLRVSSVSRSLTGPSEVFFSPSPKKAYVSRMYYKSLIERINETRLLK